MAYFEIEPFDEQRADLRAATIASLIANVNRKSGSQPFSEIDFMPYAHNKKKIKDRALAKQIQNFLAPRVKKR